MSLGGRPEFMIIDDPAAREPPKKSREVRNFGLDPKKVDLTPGPYAHLLADARANIHLRNVLTKAVHKAQRSKHIVQGPEP